MLSFDNIPVALKNDILDEVQRTPFDADKYWNNLNSRAQEQILNAILKRKQKEIDELKSFIYTNY